VFFSRMSICVRGLCPSSSPRSPRPRRLGTRQLRSRALPLELPEISSPSQARDSSIAFEGLCPSSSPRSPRPRKLGTRQCPRTCWKRCVGCACTARRARGARTSSPALSRATRRARQRVHGERLARHGPRDVRDAPRADGVVAQDHDDRSLALRPSRPKRRRVVSIPPRASSPSRRRSGETSVPPTHRNALDLEGFAGGGHWPTSMRGARRTLPSIAGSAAKDAGTPTALWCRGGADAVAAAPCCVFRRRS
jgi:hypothetical protein